MIGNTWSPSGKSTGNINYPTEEPLERIYPERYIIEGGRALATGALYHGIKAGASLLKDIRNYPSYFKGALADGSLKRAGVNLTLDALGAGAVDEGSKLLTGRTWGQNVSNATGVPEWLGDMTNVGWNTSIVGRMPFNINRVRAIISNTKYPATNYSIGRGGTTEATHTSVIDNFLKDYKEKDFTKMSNEDIKNFNNNLADYMINESIEGRTNYPISQVERIRKQGRINDASNNDIYNYYANSLTPDKMVTEEKILQDYPDVFSYHSNINLPKFIESFKSVYDGPPEHLETIISDISDIYKNASKNKFILETMEPNVNGYVNSNELGKIHLGRNASNYDISHELHHDIRNQIANYLIDNGYGHLLKTPKELGITNLSKGAQTAVYLEPELEAMRGLGYDADFIKNHTIHPDHEIGASTVGEYGLDFYTDLKNQLGREPTLSEYRKYVDEYNARKARYYWTYNGYTESIAKNRDYEVDNAAKVALTRKERDQVRDQAYPKEAILWYRFPTSLGNITKTVGAAAPFVLSLPNNNK